MEISATYIFKAPRERVWEALLDSKAVAACMPGCEKLEPIGPDKYQAVLSVGIAGIKGRYNATITLADQRPPESYRLLLDGKGGPGFVNGQALITLSEDGGRTTVQVKGDAKAGGLIAQMGQRLVGSVNKMMMGRFFECMQKRVAGTPARATEPGEAEA